MSSTTFRRTALSLALLTLPATAALAADALPQVKIAVNDKQCEPMTLTIPAGKPSSSCITTAKKVWNGKSLKASWWWKSAKTSPQGSPKK